MYTFQYSRASQMVGKLINIKLYYRYVPQIQRQEFQGALWKWYSWQFSKIPNKKSRSESLIEKVAGCWLIKKRLRYRYFPAKFLRQLFLRTFASSCKNSTIINCFVKINHLLQQRKEKSWSFCPLSFSVATVEYAQTKIVCSNESGLQSLSALMWPALTNQISRFLRSNYEFSLHIRAEVPNKKLIWIHRETVQLVVFVNKRRE